MYEVSKRHFIRYLIKEVDILLNLQLKHTAIYSLSSLLHIWSVKMDIAMYTSFSLSVERYNTHHWWQMFVFRPLLNSFPYLCIRRYVMPEHLLTSHLHTILLTHSHLVISFGVFFLLSLSLSCSSLVSLQYPFIFPYSNVYFNFRAFLFSVFSLSFSSCRSYAMC